MSPTAKPASRGFTLVELLVALTILSLISGLIFGSLRLGMTVADSVDWQVSRAQRIHLVQRMLRKQIQQALAVPRKGGFAANSLDFDASTAHLEFVAPVTVGTGYAGLYRVSLSIADDRDRSFGARKLLLRFRLLTPDDGARFQGYDVQEYVILDQFVDAEFSFLDAADNGAMNWVYEWNDRREMPSLVRLRVRYAAGDASTWPDLIVALKMTSLTNIDDT